MLGYQRHAFLQAMRSLAKRYDILRLMLTTRSGQNVKKTCVNDSRKNETVFSSEVRPRGQICDKIRYIATKDDKLRQKTTTCDKSAEVRHSRPPAKVGHSRPLEKSAFSRSALLQPRFSE